MPTGCRVFPKPSGYGEEFYITARTGFHFHNTYIEVLVELGFVGLALIADDHGARNASGHLIRLLDDRNDSPPTSPSG